MNNWKPITIGNFTLRPNEFSLFAGPCAIESETQLNETARFLKSQGAHVLRGGMFKLRTAPDSFQGLGNKAFELVKKIKLETSLPFVSEVTDPRQIGDFMDIVDAFQVGSRNMHNYSLLKELGQIRKPIILKRGFSGLVKEWLLAADYVIQGGNEQVILCERGIRTFETCTRNTFDLNAIAYVKQYHSLPVIADPSHATGDSNLVIPMALAAATAGADGLIVEVHDNPKEALSDGFQALTFKQFEVLNKKLNALLPILDKVMP